MDAQSKSTKKLRKLIGHTLVNFIVTQSSSNPSTTTTRSLTPCIVVMSSWSVNVWWCLIHPKCVIQPNHLSHFQQTDIYSHLRPV
jgi:hypothetical protein